MTTLEKIALAYLIINLAAMIWRVGFDFLMIKKYQDEERKTLTWNFLEMTKSRDEWKLAARQLDEELKCLKRKSSEGEK